MLVNSISKAIKFLLAKGCIDLHNYVQDSEIIINITSDALGLCQSDQGHILDCFYYVEETLENHYLGLDLGLYAFSEMVKTENDRVWIVGFRQTLSGLS